MQSMGDVLLRNNHCTKSRYVAKARTSVLTLMSTTSGIVSQWVIGVVIEKVYTKLISCLSFYATYADCIAAAQLTVLTPSNIERFRDRLITQ